MKTFLNKDQPQATRAFMLIQHQLMKMTKDCGNALQNGQLSHDHVVQLDNKQQRILYKTRSVCSPPLEKPKKSDFDLVKPIARGAFGTVNLVYHKETQKVLAMKEIKVKGKDDRKHVLMERDIMSFIDHPFVLPMLCSFEAENNLYMVMEYAGGGDCLSLFLRAKDFSEDMLRFYIAELVLAVEYIHSLGIVHRDIKPNNMLISKDGHLKLIDFGISKMCSMKRGKTCLAEEDCQQVAREFNDRQVRGTCFFIAPEVWLREGYGKPIDWWAIGVIVFACLNFTFPFDGETEDDILASVVNDELTWPEDGPPVSDETRSLVLRLLDKDPVKRLGTRGASEVKQQPYFSGVDWNDLPNQTPPFIPVLADEEDTSYFSNLSSDSDDDKSGDKDDQKESTDEESHVEPADFSYVAFQFNKVYGSPELLSSHTSPEQPGHKDKKVKKMNPVKRFFKALLKFIPRNYFQKKRLYL